MRTISTDGSIRNSSSLFSISDTSPAAANTRVYWLSFERDVRAFHREIVTVRNGTHRPAYYFCEKHSIASVTYTHTPAPYICAAGFTTENITVAKPRSEGRLRWRGTNCTRCVNKETNPIAVRWGRKGGSHRSLVPTGRIRVLIQKTGDPRELPVSSIFSV